MNAVVPLYSSWRGESTERTVKEDDNKQASFVIKLKRQVRKKGQ